MRLLVIGGTQFIGHEIVGRLAARGHEVTVPHRRDHHHLGAAIRNLQADRSDLPAGTRAVSERRFDAVVDLAYDWAAGATAGHVQHKASAGSP